MTTWNATYFDTFDTRLPAARTAQILADDERLARSEAIAGMGRCKIVYVARDVPGAFDARPSVDPESGADLI
jgi:hypothetical protein